IRRPAMLRKVQEEIRAAVGGGKERVQADDDVGFGGTHFELLPFGAGRRMCPGMALGVATVEFTLANLLYCFDWELPEGVRPEDVSMEEAGGLTVHKKT